MKIEFNRYSSEALDNIVNSFIIDDWRSVKDECKRVKNILKREDCTSEWRKVCEQDLKFNKKIKKAYETILRYSLPYDQVTELLGEEKCKTDGQ